MTSKPDRETKRSFVAVAVRAPSVHNTQPWRWAIGHETVHLYADLERRLSVTDPGGRDLMLSCGAALHHLRIAAAAAGWGTKVHRLPNPADPDHLASVEFYSRPAATRDLALSALVPQRRTDRRRFSSWPVPAGMVADLVSRAAEQGAILVPATEPRTRFRLVSAIAEAARRHATDPNYASELGRWLGGGFTATDGIPSENIPLRPTRYGDTQLREFPGGTLTQAVGDEDEDAGQLLILATSSDDTVSRLRAGEAMSAVLLAATDFHLSSCPLSEPLENDATRIFLRDHVLDDAAFPQMVLRIGWAPLGSDPVPVTPRRAVDEVLTDLPD